MYDWIETTFNVSGGVTQAIAVILALGAVLLLFSLFIFILKRLTGANVTHSRSRQPRIAVMDSATVDTRRRLVLVRRDNVEHLILIGGPSDVVVEQNIVRNAPLPTHRSIPVTTQPVGTSIKAPLAPGPNIPLRPDDSIAETDPLTPPAPIEPFTPQLSSTPVPNVDDTPVAAEKEAPVPSVTPLPENGSSSEKREPSLSFGDEKIEKKAEGSGGNGRAAELLRAAMQNGFNRATTKAPDSAPETDKKIDKEEPAEKKVAAPLAAPAVKLAPASAPSSAELTVNPEINPSAPVKPIGRPFSPKDRPSYGGHSISPPASGPAARAKTALFKAASSTASDAKIEPVVGKPSGVTSQDLTEEKVSTSVSSKFSVKAPDIKSPAPSVTAPELKTSEAEKAAGDTKTADSTNATDQVASVSDSSAQSPQETKSDDTRPEGISVSTEKSAPEVKLDLGLEDLIEETSENTPATASDKEEANKAEDKETEASQSQKQQQQQTKAAAPEAKSLSEKNPIEDEMAKLLDELGGQPN
ncbi:flagellar biosynthetic protein FliO [Roseibium sp. SCP14]|uniref:flagellar biosynthetic protein FliO n=1 Tax=Roseibium sp. SCP14 TaxID=3141375 RepID=UPI00333AC8F5